MDGLGGNASGAVRISGGIRSHRSGIPGGTPAVL
jgi:hypothetical protein